LLKRALASIPAARVVSVKGADHSLSVSRKDPMKGSDAWLDEAALFIREHA
ncbi:MAG: hypothetical protein H6719_00245, partial [Sandaracinaceae bacterium]|nr:hypothetical protein [Sandaracinaceae bacterium]